jgi:5-methylcytosine-specific restriction endonuclease McrA
MGTIITRTKVLVLNQDYQAIGVCSAERAFVLVYLQKAELLHEHPHLRLHTIDKAFSFPSIIRLYRYIHVPYKKVQLSRQNVFRRDAHECLYCGSHHDLTIDHVTPKFLGGKDTWENLATACQSCNSKKGHLTPEAAGMTLKYTPFRPSFVMYLSNFSNTIQEDWKPYLYMA